MKKIYIFIALLMILAICFCSCTNLSDNNIKDIDAQSVEEYLKNNDISLDGILDDNGYLIVALQNSIIINDKELSKTKFIKYNRANSICSSNNKLYFLNVDKNTINSLDLKTYDIETQYSSDSPIQQFYSIGNGNLLIEAQDDSQSIYNPIIKRSYDVLDLDAYKGTDYCIDSDKTGIYISDKHIEGLGYISEICKIGDDLYYKTDFNNDKTAIVKLSAETYKKATILQFDMSDNNGFISECPKGLYDYNSRLFVYVGINQKYDSSSDYERGELWEIDSDGNINQKYKFNEIPDSSTFTFYDGKLFYYDVNDKLNSIDL